jgi:hypothetical protein
VIQTGESERHGRIRVLFWIIRLQPFGGIGILENLRKKFLADEHDFSISQESILNREYEKESYTKE